MTALPTRTRLGYSLGSLVTGPFGTVPGLLLLPYLTDTLGVASGVAGAIVFVPKVWDVLFNPFAGRMSDSDLAKTGSRRRFILGGGIGVAVLFAAIFAYPGFANSTADGIYVVVAFFLCATAFAFFQVPFNALPAEITGNYDERTRLTSWRIGVLAVAILFSGGVAPLITTGIGGVAGYRVMGIVVAVLMIGGTIAVFLGTRGAPVGAERPQTTRFSELWATMRSWRSFRWLLGLYFVQSLGISIVLAGVSYAAKYIIGDESAKSLLFAAVVGPALLMMPVWPRIGARWGKVAGFRAASIVLSVALLCLLGAKVLPLWVTLLVAALVGVGYGGVQVFPLAILPDLIEDEEKRTGERRAGIAAGIWTAGDTLGLALGGGIFGQILAAGDYVSSTDANAAQPGSAITAILVGFSVLPAVLVALGIPLLRKSVLDRT
ncbi:MFS transporter [Amycolatopsis sp. CA-230715]|uniref:MFS transporter n=1 Tax=Amycolatopsis sp. CA-230715 TaxID=2745196 RepID=UPI001C02D6F0|nr:MFS transporter [Amycolatopsis sp. CA-230715]QWF85548.1 Putative glycoside/cation symporter YagG [Amycolatopsis sp. CA-230715]